MTSPETIAGLGLLLAYLIATFGAWVLHRRRRSATTLLCVAALIAIAIWLPASTALNQYLIYEYGALDAPEPSGLANWVYIASELFIVPVLSIVAAVGFWLSVRSLPRNEHGDGI